LSSIPKLYFKRYPPRLATWFCTTIQPYGLNVFLLAPPRLAAAYPQARTFSGLTYRTLIGKSMIRISAYARRSHAALIGTCKKLRGNTRAGVSSARTTLREKS